MGHPAAESDAAGHHHLSVREARFRLPQLIAMIKMSDRVTVLTDDAGQPAAALVPPAAARTTAQLRAARARAEASAAGWSRRLDEVRAQSARRHAAELQACAEALAQAWAVLHDRCPPGVDPTVDRLRAAHAPWLPRPRTGAD